MFIPFTYVTEKTAPIGEWSLEMLPCCYFDNKLWLNLYSISHLRKLERLKNTLLRFLNSWLKMCKE